MPTIIQGTVILGSTEKKSTHELWFTKGTSFYLEFTKKALLNLHFNSVISLWHISTKCLLCETWPFYKHQKVKRWEVLISLPLCKSDHPVQQARKTTAVFSWLRRSLSMWYDRWEAESEIQVTALWGWDSRQGTRMDGRKSKHHLAHCLVFKPALFYI